MENFSIPKNVRIIGYQAFADCSGLKSVYMQNKEMNIRDNVFTGCSSLTDIWFCANEPITLKFDGNITPKMHVPYGHLDAWRQAYPDNEMTECGIIYFENEG